jgi:hypothetical protein
VAHIWGDKWFNKYGGEFNKAMNSFYNLNRLFRGPWFVVKEKYGTMRLEWFNLSPMIDIWLFRRNSVVMQYPRLHKVSKLLYPVFRVLCINILAVKWQVFVFNIVSLYIGKKHPKILNEVLHEPEFDELLYKWVKRVLNREDQWEEVI